MRTIAVVPVYNERSTVVAVLEKLHRMRENVDEIVVVDDGSTDGSSALLDQWCGNKSNVRLII